MSMYISPHRSQYLCKTDLLVSFVFRLRLRLLLLLLLNLLLRTRSWYFTGQGLRPARYPHVMAAGGALKNLVRRQADHPEVFCVGCTALAAWLVAGHLTYSFCYKSHNV